jgi:hypothetical protein
MVVFWIVSGEVLWLYAIVSEEHVASILRTALFTQDTAHTGGTNELSAEGTRNYIFNDAVKLLLFEDEDDRVNFSKFSPQIKSSIFTSEIV